MASSQAGASAKGTTPSSRRASPHASDRNQLQQSSSPFRALASSPSGASEYAAEEMALAAMASALVPTTTSTSLARPGGLKRKAEALDIDGPTAAAATPSTSKKLAADQPAPTLHAAAPSPASHTFVAPPGRGSGAAAASAPSLLSRLSPMVPRQAVPHREPCAAASEASAKRQRRGGHPARERRLERRRLERLAREGEESSAEQAKDAE